MTEIKISDQNLFKKLVLLKIANAQDERLVKIKNIRTVTSLDLKKANIKAFPELQYFSALETLDLSNNKIQKINLSKNKKLKHVNLENNKLNSELNLSELKTLLYLNCKKNKIKTILLPQTRTLKEINVSENCLKILDLSYSKGLTVVDAKKNAIDDIIFGNKNLFYLNCSNNHLKSLDLSNQKFIVYLDVSYNKLNKFYLPTRFEFERFYYFNNPLVSDYIEEILRNKNELQLLEDNQEEWDEDDDYWLYFMENLFQVADRIAYSTWGKKMIVVDEFLHKYDKSFIHHYRKKGVLILKERAMIEFNIAVNCLEIDKNKIRISNSKDFIVEEMSVLNCKDFPYEIKIKDKKGLNVACYFIKEGHFNRNGGFPFPPDCMFLEYIKTSTSTDFPSKFILVND